jgi:hypothetical protein
MIRGVQKSPMGRAGIQHEAVEIEQESVIQLKLALLEQ